MEITTLGSGSKGNSLLLKSRQAAVLVDAGLSLEDTLTRLLAVKQNPKELSAILVTHAHGDHTRSVRRLADRFRLPVYSGEETFKHRALKRVKNKFFFENGKTFAIEDLEVTPVRLAHDAEPTFGFRFDSEGKTYGQATDLGQVTEEASRGLRDCQVLLLEFNHDRRMLETGPYPPFLKNRVGSDVGHLSNDQSADLLRSVLHADLQQVILGHLSETNNRPDIAMESAQRILVGEGMDRTIVTIAPQHHTGPTLVL